MKRNLHQFDLLLLKKPSKVNIDDLVNYIGFNISGSFVIGYGLDYAQKFRGLSSIYNLNPKKEN